MPYAASAPRLPWQQAWHQALYGPAGFYRRPEGPAGHFATSAQGIPHGADVLAHTLVALAERGELRHVVDFGAGRGELATAIAQRAPHLRVTAVDVVPRPPELPAAVHWWTSPGAGRLPEQLVDLTRTLLVAHEWLDVVPCPLVSRAADGWRYLDVDHTTGTETLAGPLTPEDAQWIQRWAALTTQRAEVGRPRDQAWSELSARVSQGLALAIDYGYGRSEQPDHGTLAGYLRGRQVSPIPDGSMDLTAHVALESLQAAVPGTCLARQRDVIEHALGPASLPAQDRARHEPQTYLREVAQHSARRALQARGGLGDFWWIGRAHDCPALADGVV